MVYVKIHVKKLCKGFFFEKKSICEVFINLKDNEKPIFNNYNRRYSINHTQHYIKYPKQQSYTLLDIHHYIQLINYNPNQSYNYTIKAWTFNMNYLLNYYLEFSQLLKDKCQI